MFMMFFSISFLHVKIHMHTMKCHTNGHMHIVGPQLAIATMRSRQCHSALYLSGVQTPWGSCPQT